MGILSGSWLNLDVFHNLRQSGFLLSAGEDAKPISLPHILSIMWTLEPSDSLPMGSLTSPAGQLQK